MSTISSAIAVALSSILSPLTTALEGGVSNPENLVANLKGLAVNSVINLPTLEDDAMSAGCEEALTLLQELQDKLDGATSAKAPASPVAIPLTVTTAS